MRKHYVLYITIIFFAVLFLTVFFSKNSLKAQVEYGMGYQAAIEMLPWPPSGLSARVLPGVVRLKWKPSNLEIVTHSEIIKFTEIPH